MAKTTSGFNSDRTVRQYPHDLLLESSFVPSSTDRWAVRPKIRQKRAVSVAVVAKPEVEIWRRPKKQLFDPGFLFTPSDSFWLGRTVSPQYKTSQTDRRQTDRRHTVPKARPIVRSANNEDCFNSLKDEFNGLHMN